MAPIRDYLEMARRYVSSDPHFANYVLRDQPEVRDAGLSDLAWAMHRDTPSSNDVRYLIEQLEAWLEVVPEGYTRGTRGYTIRLTRGAEVTTMAEVRTWSVPVVFNNPESKVTGIFIKVEDATFEEAMVEAQRFVERHLPLVRVNHAEMRDREEVGGDES